MPIVEFPVPSGSASIEELRQIVAIIAENAGYVLTGQLDTKNAREFSGWRIKPNVLVSKDNDVGMSTDDTGTDPVRFFAGPNGDVWFFYVTKSGKLYATDAFITGRIEGSVIIGSEIKTSETTYPRVELSSVGNIFKALKSATDSMVINPDFSGSPTIIWDNGTVTGSAGNFGAYYLLQCTQGKMRIRSNSDIEISAGAHVILDSWANIYSDGESETLQDALDGVTTTGGGSTIVTDNLITNRAVISNGSGKVAVSATTSTELGYVSGVTSAIQTQLNAKANSAQPSPTTLTLINGATAFGGGYDTPSYYKDTIGKVNLGGVFSVTTSPSTIATLPAGYRPLLAKSFIIASGSSGSGRVDVLPNGNINFAGSLTQNSLDQVFFLAQQ